MAVAVVEVAVEVAARSGGGVEAGGAGEDVALVRKAEDGQPKVKAGADGEGEGGVAVAVAVAATPLTPERATPATKRRSANGKSESGSGSGSGSGEERSGGRRKRGSSRRRKEKKRESDERGRGSGCSRISQTAAPPPWRAAAPPSRPLLSLSERQQSLSSAPSSPGRDQSPSGLRRPRPSVDPPLSSTRKLWRLPSRARSCPYRRAARL